MKFVNHFSIKILTAMFLSATLSGCSYWNELGQAVWPDDTTESDILVTEEEQPPPERVQTSNEQLAAEVSVHPEPQYAEPMVRADVGSAAASGYDVTALTLPFPPMVEVSDTGTFTAGITANIRADLSNLQNILQAHSDEGANAAAELRAFGESFYGIVAAIEARLQSGTTTANPILVEQWNEARYQLDQAGVSLSRFSQIRNNTVNDSGFGRFLLDNTAQALSLPGSVVLDKQQLQALELEIGSTIIIGEALGGKFSQEVERQSAFLRSGERTLTVLSRSIKDGTSYGRSLSAPLGAGGGAAPVAAKIGGKVLLAIKVNGATSEADSMRAIYDVIAATDKTAARFEVLGVMNKDTRPDRAMVIRSQAKNAAVAIADFGISPSRISVGTLYADIPDGEIRIVAHG